MENTKKLSIQDYLNLKFRLASLRINLEMAGNLQGWSRRSIAQKFRRLRERIESEGDTK